MIKPTRLEIVNFIEVVKMISRPKTERGLLRIVAKHFHCTSKEIKELLAN